jgi:hypothetical protein
VNPGELIAAVREAAAEARERSGHADVDAVFGGQAVRIQVAPASLRELLAPLAGTNGAAEASHTIELWDASACGLDPPELPRWAGRPGLMGELRWLDSPTTAGAWQEPGPIVLTWDARGATVSGWIGDSSRLAAWERAAPLRAALNWVLRGPGRTLAHAAAVGRSGGGPGLLIGGPGGSGKSTTALSWLLAGGDFAGDDYVLVDLGGPDGPTAAPVYATAKADPTALALLPELASTGAVGEDELAGKSVIDVRDLRPGQPAGPIPIAAVVIPRVASRARPLVRSLPGAAALKALAPSSLLQLPRERGGLAVLAALVREVPCFSIDLASEPAANLEALESTLPA